MILKDRIAKIILDETDAEIMDAIMAADEIIKEVYKDMISRDWIPLATKRRIKEWYEAQEE